MGETKYTIEIPEENKDYYRKAFLLMNLIDNDFYKIFLQKDRIEKDITENNLKSIFADIHFFLISLSGLKRGLDELKKISKDDKDYEKIYENYIGKIESLKVFRDHLEHIHDGRLEGKGKNGKPLKTPAMLGNLINGNYDLGGESFNLPETFKFLENLKKEMIDWNLDKKIYPFWYVDEIVNINMMKK